MRLDCWSRQRPALLAAMFSANVRAARHNLTIGGKTATALPLRTLIQVVFIAALLAAGFLTR